MHDKTARLTATRSQLDVMKAQVQAIDAWNRAQALTASAAAGISMTRETRLDLARRSDARRREHDAIISRVDAQLRASADALTHRPATTAVVAHRNAWMADKLCALLAGRGVEVIGVFDDGADAAGTVVAEQPDLVVLEDRLPTLKGLDLVRRVRSYSPQSVIGAQTLDSGGVSPLIDAGAHAVFTRRIPPAEVVEQLVACLQGEVRSLKPLALV